MFIVLEIQKMSESSVAIPTPIYSTADKFAAESEFHRLSSIAAVSSVPVHSVMILADEGYVQKVETYFHD